MFCQRKKGHILLQLAFNVLSKKEVTELKRLREYYSEKKCEWLNRIELKCWNPHTHTEDTVSCQSLPELSAKTLLTSIKLLLLELPVAEQVFLHKYLIFSTRCGLYLIGKAPIYLRRAWIDFCLHFSEDTCWMSKISIGEVGLISSSWSFWLSTSLLSCQRKNLLIVLITYL